MASRDRSSNFNEGVLSTEIKSKITNAVHQMQQARKRKRNNNSQN